MGKQKSLFMDGGALFSKCRRYRYVLRRTWSGNPEYCMFIGLNPSTADAEMDDNTIRRCIRYAQAWGYSGMFMVNLFAYRATDPADMMAAEDPVGPENDYHIKRMAAKSKEIIAAWGNHGAYLDRDQAILNMGFDLRVLGLTGQDQPVHPLYQPKDALPVHFDYRDYKKG